MSQPNDLPGQKMGQETQSTEIRCAPLAIERHAVDPTAVLALAHRYKLTAYDAAYLWLAERLEAPLATFDNLLARAAQEHLTGGDSAEVSA
jgi:predicted nucleic acid-binding protein